MSRAVIVGLLGLSFALGASAQDVPADNSAILKFQGKVSANRGDGFVPALKKMSLKPGDRLMVQAKSKAWVKFDDDCEYEIEENRIVTIPERSTCAGGVPLVQNLAPTGSGAIGAAGAAAGGNGGWAWAIVAAIDIWWLNEDDGEFVSPPGRPRNGN